MFDVDVKMGTGYDAWLFPCEVFTSHQNLISLYDGVIDHYYSMSIFHDSSYSIHARTNKYKVHYINGGNENYFTNIIFFLWFLLIFLARVSYN